MTEALKANSLLDFESTDNALIPITPQSSQASGQFWENKNGKKAKADGPDIRRLTTELVQQFMVLKNQDREDQANSPKMRDWFLALWREIDPNKVCENFLDCGMLMPTQMAETIARGLCYPELSSLFMNVLLRVLDSPKCTSQIQSELLGILKSWGATAENILCGMMSDPETSIRRLAVVGLRKLLINGTSDGHRDVLQISSRLSRLQLLEVDTEIRDEISLILRYLNPSNPTQCDTCDEDVNRLLPHLHTPSLLNRLQSLRQDEDSICYLDFTVSAISVWGLVYLSNSRKNAEFITKFIRALEQDDPSDYPSAIAIFTKLLNIVKAEIGSRLEAPFNSYLRESETLSLDERRKIVSEINRDLSQLNLAIALPESNSPSKLVIKINGDNDGSFRLQGTRTVDEHRSTWTARSLLSHAPLRLIVDQPRIEPFARKQSTQNRRLS